VDKRSAVSADCDTCTSQSTDTEERDQPAREGPRRESVDKRSAVSADCDITTRLGSNWL
jgi:hypothetical protein